MAEKLIIERPKHKFTGYRDYIDDVPLEMVLIPDGTFIMGAPETEKGTRSNERPQHEVTISSFLMGRYPITQKQWKAIATRTDLKEEIDLEPDPSRFKDPYKGIDRWLRPVEKVNWYEAVEFCQRLSKLTGRDYQLPSEAQWEYACRAGTTTPFHFGDTITTELANYRGTDDEELKLSGSYGKGLKGKYREQTTPVGYFDVANAFGLSDMHGNVWEWCADDWHKNYTGAPTNGSAWVDYDNYQNVNSETKGYSAKKKQNKPNAVLRGGSWLEYPNNCRSALRGIFYVPRGIHLNNYGFRIVCVFERTQ
ncbi:formylglycine-generating enzyme family protein [Crocosphaera sp.]|uniref:formylglycine-generating enzyme family protein n=1 Tax=Crocosphaera sp. TaxID=2729996 RepID=UPI003F236D69|nr:formylglycine-generating enzyme family protein [Crocosphaera sp.]